MANTNQNKNASDPLTKTVLRNALLILLMLAYPLLGIIWHHDYPFFSAEVSLLLGLCAISALILASVLKFVGTAVSNLVLCVILLLVFLIHFNLFFLGLLATFITTLAVSMLFRRHFPDLLLVVMLALIAGKFVDSHLDRSRFTPEVSGTASEPTKGPLIHILLDGFIGLDGLPNLPEAGGVKSDIIAFFEHWEFEVYARAYSHYGATLDSMTRALNFRNDSANMFQRAHALRQELAFPQNAWFQALKEDGYPLVVYQTDSVNFCDEETGSVAICKTYPIPNLNSLHEGLENPVTRAKVIFKTLLAQSTLITKLQIDARTLKTWGISTYEPRMLVDLASDVPQAPGNAFFAHILMPHDPLVYREDCSLDYSIDSADRYSFVITGQKNTTEQRVPRYKNYVAQLRCALNALGAVFTAMQDAGLYEQATIVVHGDHGSSASLVNPSVRNMDLLNYRDLREVYSTLFAVRFPDSRFELIDDTLSLNVLMAKTLLRLTGRDAQSLGVEVLEEDEPFIYLNGVEPLQQMYVDIFTRPNPESE